MGEDLFRTDAAAEDRGVKLSAVLPRARFVACDDIVARGCHDDPRACRPGDVFVARSDAATDGHDIVARAIARGVSGIVAERMIPTFGTPLCLVPDSTWAGARIAHALAGDPARRMRVIAVTGTSGKTTTAWLTAAVLSEGGARVGVLSDLGCLDGDASEPVRDAWQSPPALAGWLARLAASGCTHAVVEASSGSLAESALAGVTCDAVVVTNLRRAHLDRHGTVGAYHAIKGRVLDTLGDGGCLVADVDDPGVARLADRHRRSGGEVIGIGLHRRADVTASPVERGLGGQMFLLRHAGDSGVVSVGTPVVSFVRDCLCAAAIGLRDGMTPGLVARGLEAAGSVPGRMSRIRRGQDVHVFADQPTSVHALASTLASLRRLTPGALVVLAEEKALGTLGGKARFAARVARWCDDALVVPEGMLDPVPGHRNVAAYARVDRILAGLGRRDCVLVVGRAPGTAPDPGDPGERLPLSMIVEAWMELAHPPVRGGSPRRAA